MKTVFEKFANEVKENGELVDAIPSLVGIKLVYMWKGYKVLLDTCPFAPKDLIVSVEKNDRLVYVSEATVRGLMVIGKFDEAEKLREISKPEILEEILKN